MTKVLEIRMNDAEFSEKRGIYLTGGWGYGNKGDNAIFEAMLQTFRSYGYIENLLVTSYSPKETQIHHGIMAIPSVHKLLKIRRPMSWFRWIAIWIWRISNHKVMLSKALRLHISAIRNARVLVFGGGGYFNDAWPDMLRAKYVEMEMASIVGTPTIIYGQTVGPFSDATISKTLAKNLGKITRIAYRDVQSKKILDKAQYPSSQCKLTADEANLLLHRPWSRPTALKDTSILIGIMVQELRPHLGPHGASPAGRIKSKEQYISAIVEALISIYSEHEQVGFVFVPSTTWDEENCRLVFERLKKAKVQRIQFLPDPLAKDFIAACQNVDLMISTNMHPVILAATAGAPSVALSYHYKLDDYMVSIGLENLVLRIDDFEPDQLATLIRRCIEQRRTLGEQVLSSHSSVRKQAQGNWDLLETIATC